MVQTVHGTIFLFAQVCSSSKVKMCSMNNAFQTEMGQSAPFFAGTCLSLRQHGCIGTALCDRAWSSGLLIASGPTSQHLVLAVCVYSTTTLQVAHLSKLSLAYWTLCYTAVVPRWYKGSPLSGRLPVSLWGDYSTVFLLCPKRANRVFLDLRKKGFF